MRRSLAALLACLFASAPVSARAGLLTDVPRAQFVRNVPIGHVERLPVGTGYIVSKSVDGQSWDWDAYTTPTGLGGQTTIQGGQLVYEDWIMDDAGAAAEYVVARRERNAPVEGLLGWSKYQSTDSALGEELIGDVDEAGLFDEPPLYYEKGLERYGEARYRSGTPGSADLLELRIAADEANAYFLVRFHTMTITDSPVAAIAIDATPAEAGDWGFASGVTTPLADHILTLTRDRVYLNGTDVTGTAQVASNDLGNGSEDNPGGFGGFIEASVPRSLVPGTTWNLWAGTGVWDSIANEWAAPGTDPKAQPEAAPPRVMNLAFREYREPLRPWMEEAQAFALRTTPRNLLDFFAVADLDALAAGTHEFWRVRPGYYTRIFTSRVTDGGRRNSSPAVPERGDISSRQPYGLYVPTTYSPERTTPMTVWLHWRGPGDHAAAYYVPNMVWELAERRGNVLASPRGRGSSGWYVGDSHIDVLDAMADAESFLNVDREREYVAGYSMGGWGAYLFSTLYPDRFAGAFAVVGPPAIGAWFYPAGPIEPQNGRPLYFTNPLVPNARHVPTVIFHGTDDELVPVTGTVAQSLTYQQNGQPYRFFLFPGYEHFSFAAVDEWRAAADYLGNAARVRNPGRVTYALMPCLDPVHWSPVYTGQPRSAYWIYDVEVRTAESGSACTSRSTPAADLNRTGTVDITSHALPQRGGGLPVAGAGGAPDHTTPYVMTGFEPETDTPPQGYSNGFDAVVTNVRRFSIDATRAGLRWGVHLHGTVTTDGDTLISLGVCGFILVDTEDRGYGCGVELGAGTHSIAVTPA